MASFTPHEKKLISYAKKAVVKYNKLRQSKGGIDTLYSFVLSDSGKIYDGACLETNFAANICAERHAIANMILKESYRAKVRSIVVADPVPAVQKRSTTPCGACRQIIIDFGSPTTTVLCMQYMRQKSGWIFPKIEKFSIKALYPHPFKPVVWD
jgi:cytidine deaminase